MKLNLQHYHSVFFTCCCLIGNICCQKQNFSLSYNFNSYNTTILSKFYITITITYHKALSFINIWIISQYLKKHTYSRFTVNIRIRQSGTIINSIYSSSIVLNFRIIRPCICFKSSSLIISFPTPR